jgi:hypothetical protein
MKRYRELLEAAIRAPSGDNCQPWRFEVAGNVIRLFNRPEKDTSLYNFRQRASLIAHGAFIENFSIASSVHGLNAEVSICLNQSEDDLVAEIRLVPCKVASDPLFQAIAGRCTNRRRYRGGILDQRQGDQLIEAAAPFPGFRVRLFTGKEQERLARVIGLNDRLVFENRDLHAFLFDHIRWSDAEAIATKNGMDIKTLELTPPDALAFRMFKSFNLVRFLNRFGVSRIIGANAGKLAISAAAIGIITMSGTETVDYITCGRAMERVWLEATRQGLAFQLMTGITCLMGRVAAGEPGTLIPSHVDMLKNSRNEIATILRNEQDVPIIMFRVGQALPPTAHSLRLPV